MNTEIDVIILGGGCAGLSLAWRLCELGDRCPKTLVVEQRDVYQNDRTWCFWSDGDSRVLPLIKHHWQMLELKSQNDSVHFDCGDRAYQMLAGSDFYNHVDRIIQASTSVTLSMGTTVVAEPEQIHNGWLVQTSHGTYNARMVVDTRPGGAPKVADAELWQSFYGQELTSDVQIFDPARAVLMDFTPSTSHQIPFTYILPISPYRALIEATVFGPLPLRPADLSAQFEAATLKYLGANSARVTRAESGVLPMGLNNSSPVLGRGHVKVGVMAGAARPSSGFAFQRIQRWANRCSVAISQGLDPVPHAKDRVLIRMMDHLFLKVIGSRPELAPELFLSIFKKADGASVIRFLTGQGSPQDCLRIVAALPARHFIRQLLRPASLQRLSRSSS